MEADAEEVLIPRYHLPNQDQVQPAAHQAHRSLAYLRRPHNRPESRAKTSTGTLRLPLHTTATKAVREADPALVLRSLKVDILVPAPLQRRRGNISCAAKVQLGQPENTISPVHTSGILYMEK